MPEQPMPVVNHDAGSDKIPAMTHAQLLRRLQAACDEAGSQTAFAQRLGVRPQFVNNVLAGRREPSARLLEALGYRRIERTSVTYERIPQTA